MLHFSNGLVIAPRRRYDWRTLIQILSRVGRHRYSVNFSSYYKISSEVRYIVACCEERKIDKMDDVMKRRKYTPMEISTANLYSRTRMRVELDGPYRVVNNLVELE